MALIPPTTAMEKKVERRRLEALYQHQEVMAGIAEQIKTVVTLEPAAAVAAEPV